MSRGRIKLGALAAVATFVFAGYVAAQQATEEPRERQLERSGVQTQERSATTEAQSQQQQRSAAYRAGGQAGQSQQIDKFLASCLLVKNKAQVELAQFAQQQAENPRVKQFAQMLAQDHQQVIQKLQPIAGDEAGRQSAGATRQSDQQRPGQQQSASARGGQAGGDVTEQLIDIDKQIAERCLEITKDKLQEKQGAEFDKAFVGCQIAAHIDALAALDVIEQQSTGQLAQVAQQAKQSVQQHLQQAEQLMQQLDQGGSQTRTQRTPGTQQQ